MDTLEKAPGRHKDQGPCRTMLCLFIHRYRWGRQIRGDERGFLEKARVYKARRICLLTVEMPPSFQRDMGENAYDSFEMRKCRLPIRSPLDLATVLFMSIPRLVLARFEKPSAIYAYNQDPENVITGYLLKIILHRPLVIVYHHLLEDAFASLQVGIASRRQRGYGLASSIWRSIVPAVNRFSAIRADGHLALSKATRTDVAKSLGIHDCVVVGNGLDHEKFSESRRSQVFEAVFLGRLTPQKGIDILLKSWSIVRGKLPQAKLLLLGGGEKNNIETYRAMTRDLGIDDAVIFKGFVGDKELVELLNSSKVFVFPSRNEGFAQAVSQAMGCGLCCVLSNIPPLKDVYDDVAIFVPPDRPVELADAVLSVLADDGERVKLGARGRAHVQQFSWEKVVDKESDEISHAILNYGLARKRKLRNP
ncbi:MAG: glycosyltransferase family 4 protein [Thaumarchaeota archaeon]|nr:glycosyltransferase family 4 protein [Nitrososphaerota archaeon]